MSPMVAVNALQVFRIVWFHSIIQDEFVDEPAAFGDGLPLEGLKGFLVPGVPKDGCKVLAPPPSSDNFTGKWIVLLARFNCYFEDKIRNAQSAGYDAVIVHNVNSSDLERMSAKNAVGIKIPSVFVGNDTGYDLETKYTYLNNCFIIMNREVPFDINTHLLLPFGVVVSLCLIIMIIFMIVKCVKDRRRAQRHRLPNNALKKIPTCRYSKGDPYDTCAICLDDYVEGDKLRVLPCAHAYHCKCIDPWLTKNRRVCPVCKRRVLARGESRHMDSGSDSDDSSAPLVTSARNNTQGGTFDAQRENPFSAAERFVARLQRQYNPRRSTRRQRDSAPSNRNAASEGESTRSDSTTNPTDEIASNPQSSAGGGSNVPFLSGVLNLRSNHFGRGDSEDTERLLPQSAHSTLPTRSCESYQEHERRERRDRRSRRRASSGGRGAGAGAGRGARAARGAGDAGQGEIGVAALPNTQPSINQFIL